MLKTHEEEKCKTPPNILQRLRTKSPKHLKAMNAQEKEVISKLQLEIADMKVHMERCHQSAVKEQQQINDSLSENGELRNALDPETRTTLDAVKQELTNEKLTNERLSRNYALERDKCAVLVAEQESCMNAIKNEQLRCKRLEAEFFKREENLLQEVDALKEALVKSEISNRKLEGLLEDEKQYNKIEKICYEENMKAKARELLKHVSNTSQLTTVDACKKVITQLECNNQQLNELLLKKTEKIHNICILYLRLKASKDFVTTQLKCLIEEFDEINSDLTNKLTEVRNEINAVVHIGSRGKADTKENPSMLQIVQRNAQLALENATMRLEVCHMKQILLTLKHASGSATENSESVTSYLRSSEIGRSKSKYAYRPSRLRDSQCSRIGTFKNKSEFSLKSVYTPVQHRSDYHRSKSRSRSRSKSLDIYTGCRQLSWPRGYDNSCRCRKSSVISRNRVCCCIESSISSREELCYCRERSAMSRRDVCRERSFSMVDGCYGDRNRDKQFFLYQEENHRVNQYGDGQVDRVKYACQYNDEYQAGNEEIIVPRLPRQAGSHSELCLSLNSATNHHTDARNQAVDGAKCRVMSSNDAQHTQEPKLANTISAAKQASEETIATVCSLGNTLVATRSAPEIMQSGQFCKLPKGIRFSSSCTK